MISAGIVLILVGGVTCAASVELESPTGMGVGALLVATGLIFMGLSK